MEKTNENEVEQPQPPAAPQTEEQPHEETHTTSIDQPKEEQQQAVGDESSKSQTEDVVPKVEPPITTNVIEQTQPTTTVVTEQTQPTTVVTEQTQPTTTVVTEQTQPTTTVVTPQQPQPPTQQQEQKQELKPEEPQQTTTKPTVIRKCITHPNELCNSYCRDCYLIICQECTQQSHKQHQTIENITSDDIKLLLPTFTNFTTYTSQIKDDRAHLQKMLTQLEDNVKSCRSSIVEQFKDLQFLIKQREMKLEKEIMVEYEQSKAEILKRISLLDRDIKNGEPLVEPANTFQSANLEDLFTSKRFEFLDKYSELKQIPRRIEQEPPVELTVQFDLSVDIDKRSMITQEVQSLGTISSKKKSTQTVVSNNTTPSVSSPTQSSNNNNSANSNANQVASPNTINERLKRDRQNTILQSLSANEGLKYFYTIGGWNENGSDISTIYKYDVEKNDWKFISSKGLPTTEGVPFVSSSCVSDGKYIYVFGGNYTNTTYRRFNLAKQQWDKSLEKLNRGGGGVAAQYDGKKYVYLFGGKVMEDKQYHQIVHRIERLNISTKQIEHLNNMTRHKYTIYPCFDGRNIYLVGGQVVNGRACKEIECYDTLENTCTVFSSLGAGGLVQGACIDAKFESIFYITQTQFKRFTLATKKFETLDFPPLSNTTCRPSMIYDTKTRIYLFDQNDNYVYDIPTARWNKFTYTRKVALCGQGIVGSMI